jgi:hypothetical protein
MITAGHSAAAGSLLLARKPRGCGCLSMLVASYTLMAVLVLWYWN